MLRKILMDTYWILKFIRVREKDKLGGSVTGSVSERSRILPLPLILLKEKSNKNLITKSRNVI